MTRHIRWDKTITHNYNMNNACGFAERWWCAGGVRGRGWWWWWWWWFD